MNKNQEQNNTGPQNIQSSGGADQNIIGQFNNPEMIDDLDMNAGYDSEDYGNEFVDLGDIQDELGTFKGAVGTAPAQSGPQINPSKPAKSNIYDKYANFDDEEDFAENFDDDIFNDKSLSKEPEDKFNQLSGSLKGISKMVEEGDDEEGVPLGDFLASMRAEEDANEKGGAKEKPKSTKAIDNYEDDIFDLQGANSDDEEADNFQMNGGSLNDLASPIKDDAYEGQFEHENDASDPSLKPIQLTEDNEQEPDFSKMNGLSLMAGKKQDSKDIDIRKGISIEKGPPKTGQKGDKKQDINIVQHSQSHFQGVKGIVIEKPTKKGIAALQSFANAGGANHMQMGDFQDDEEEDSDTGEANEFNPPADAQKAWETSDMFERWIIIEGVSKAPQDLISQTCNPHSLNQKYKKQYNELTKKAIGENLKSLKTDKGSTEIKKEMIKEENAYPADQKDVNKENEMRRSNEATPAPDVEVKPLQEKSKPTFGKKKLNKADFMFKAQKDQMLVKMPGDINGIDFMIKDLENCTVMLMDHTAQITVDRCKNTKFYIGPVKSSIFFRDCSDCEITVSCQQFRCRDLTKSQLWLYTPNDPIVESSSNLIIAPYNFKYPHLKQHVDKAELIGTFIDDDGIKQTKVNKWSQIYDFTKQNDGSLNFKLLEPSSFKLISYKDVNSALLYTPDDVTSDREYLFELNIDYGGKLSNEVTKAADSLMAFDIRTGAKAAQEAFQKKEEGDAAKEAELAKMKVPGPSEITKPPEEVKPVQDKPKPTFGKKKLNKADFMFKAQKDQTLVKIPGDINGIDFMIKDLENCFVMLLDHTAQITVDRCKNTKFYIGPVKSSIFFRDCSNCEITVSCQQFRCRDLVKSKLWLYTPNDPIVESSTDLTFAPYNFKYPQLKEHVDKAELIGEFTDDDGILQQKVNKWSQIYDFTQKDDGGLNFKLLKPIDFKIIDYKTVNQSLTLKDVEADKDYLFELNVDYGGILSSDVVKTADGLMAFDIRTGAEEAQKAFLKKEEEELKKLIPGPNEVTKTPQIISKPQEKVTEQKQPTPAIAKKKKLNKADYMFKAQKDKMLVKMPGDIDGIDFMIKDLENCTVMILDHTAQITVDRCKNTKFFIGPVKSSIFFRDCYNCDLTVSCQQFRCRDLVNSNLWLYTPNDPIVESSKGLQFAPYNFKYPQLKQHVDKAELIGEFTDDDGIVQQKVNKWNQIYDFTKREDEVLNYRFIQPNKFRIINFKMVNKDIEIAQDKSQESQDYLFELNQDFGGTLKNEVVKVADSLMAFDIKTGAKAAQEAFDKKEADMAIKSNPDKEMKNTQEQEQKPKQADEPEQVKQDTNKPKPSFGKKKLNKADFMFKAQKDQMLIKIPGDINGIDFMIKDLENCTVMLLDHTAQITVDRCKNTKFYIGPVKSSIFFRDCSDCEITVSCQQFRCRDLVKSKLWLYTPNDPIVESSSDLIFSPYNFKYPQLKEHVDKAELIGEFTDDDGVVQKKVNKWNQIYDFTKKDDGSLNFKEITPSEFKIIDFKSVKKDLVLPQIESTQDQDYLFELSVDFGGTLSNDIVKAADSLMAFDIRTGAQAAQEAFEKKEAKTVAKLATGPSEVIQPQKATEKVEEKLKPTFGKKKLNKADFMFKAQKDQMLVKVPGDINGIDFMIKDLENCTVMLLDHTAQVTVDRCRNTKFYLGPVKNSIFFRNCSDCEITVSCQQFRCRDLTKTKLWLYTPNDPIVESSQDLQFAPYNFKYPNLKTQVDKAELIGEFTDDDGVVQQKVNKWNQIYDFTKKDDGTSNFEFIDPKDFKIIDYKVINPQLELQDLKSNDQNFLFELSVDFGGTLSNKVTQAADSLMVFDIRTGAEAAQAAFDKKQAEELSQKIPGPSEVTKAPLMSPLEAKPYHTQSSPQLMKDDDVLKPESKDDTTKEMIDNLFNQMKLPEEKPQPKKIVVPSNIINFNSVGKKLVVKGLKKSDKGPVKAPSTFSFDQPIAKQPLPQRSSSLSKNMAKSLLANFKTQSINFNPNIPAQSPKQGLDSEPKASLMTLKKFKLKSVNRSTSKFTQNNNPSGDPLSNNFMTAHSGNDMDGRKSLLKLNQGMKIKLKMKNRGSSTMNVLNEQKNEKESQPYSDI